ncbi:GNAT family N-acetyltransferase [Pseudonocardia spinosispora]|uniref:GNAT family N-acetyltransferase n=1 Tax=Pseudonocardia spinosispora TaxID=103441 RepID=UPI001FE17263|nr:GNAT family protein [Pseudonocardia spinosispora]
MRLCAETRARFVGLVGVGWLDGGMISADVFRDQPALAGATVRLEPLTPAVLDAYLRGLDDPEVIRLTGSHASVGPDVIEHWLRTRRDHHDRADWAIIRCRDGAFLGEAVINDLDTDNHSANYRIWLAGPEVFGRGYGSEATRLVVDYALDHVGLHRLSLEVFDHNPRARRAYEKCGFTVEGRLRDALLWEGKRHDALVMSVLRTDARPE